ncbi:MAG: hypothetical protein RBR53_05200 [Desulforegulaceae bacterium]|nr:hypothetical protein [Desulforegulaceae bacterium]
MEAKNYPKDIFEFIKQNLSDAKSDIKNPYLEGLIKIVFSDLKEAEKKEF